MANMNASIITGDCIEHLGVMPAGSVNLIVADPPYNIGIDYGDGSRADRRSDADYIKWSRAWIAAASRTLAPDGAMWVICGQEYAADHQLAMRAAGLHWRNTVTWVETFGVNCRRKFSRTSRPMFYAVKHPRRFTFNVEALTTASARQTKYGDRRANAAGKVLDDVWTISRVCGTFRERVTGVPTQLPLALVRRVVCGLSRPGDLVCDPFTGSGTTGVVCAEHGRRFAGIELREQYAVIARERIANAAPAGTCSETPAHGQSHRRLDESRSITTPRPQAAVTLIGAVGEVMTDSMPPAGTRRHAKPDGGHRDVPTMHGPSSRSDARPVD